MITISFSSTAIFKLPPAFAAATCAITLQSQYLGEELVAATTWSLNVKFFLHPQILFVGFPMSCSEITVLFVFE